MEMKMAIKATLLIFTWYLFIEVKSHCQYENSLMVICTSQGLTNVPDYYPSTIKILDLSENDIQHLRHESLQKYPSLIVLNVSQNPLITKKDVAAVSVLTELSVIDMSSTQTDVLNFYIFKANLNLTEIYLRNSSITTIKEKQTNLKKLNKIVLAFNKIHRVPLQAFKGFTNLKYLDMQHNKIHFVSLQICKVLENLKHFDLTGNRILNLEPDIAGRSILTLNCLTWKYDGTTTPNYHSLDNSVIPALEGRESTAINEIKQAEGSTFNTLNSSSSNSTQNPTHQPIEDSTVINEEQKVSLPLIGGVATVMVFIIGVTAYAVYTYLSEYRVVPREDL